MTHPAMVLGLPGDAGETGLWWIFEPFSGRSAWCLPLGSLAPTCCCCPHVAARAEGQLRSPGALQAPHRDAALPSGLWTSSPPPR